VCDSGVCMYLFARAHFDNILLKCKSLFLHVLENITCIDRFLHLLKSEGPPTRNNDEARPKSN
jgi:hypothetical protein